MKHKAPAFQLYPKDFLTDLAFMKMSLEARGAYLTLLCIQWLEGWIPADKAVLAKLLGVPTARVTRAIWPYLQSRFMEVEGDPSRLQNPRLEEERTEQQNFREAMSEAGKRGANKRWSEGQAIAKPSESDSQATREPLAKNSSSSPISYLQSSSDTTIDYAPTNRTSRDSSPREPLPSSNPDQLSQLIRGSSPSSRYGVDDVRMVTNAIERYMEGDTPDYDIVTQTLDASGDGFTGTDVCERLSTLWNKGYRPGTENGPRTFGWFPAVIRQYFDEQRAMAAARGNPLQSHSNAGASPADADFDVKLDAF